MTLGKILILRKEGFCAKAEKKEGLLIIRLQRW